MTYDDLIDRLAVGQRGVVTREQLRDAGMSADAVQRRLSTGRLVRLHGGVYLVQGHPLQWPAQLLAAVYAGGHGAVASHRAAGFLHALSGVEAGVELTVPAGWRRRLHGVRAHRSSLTPGDVECRDGIPRTRVARTLIDLAGVMTTERLAEAVDDALTRRLITRSYLGRRLAAAGRQGRAGAGELARILATRPETRGRHQSTFERRLYGLLRRVGLPLPIPQFAVTLPSGGVAFLDSAYPESRVALEGG